MIGKKPWCFLKKKWFGSIKAWGCADGRPQSHTQKKKTSSPTISIEAIMLSCTIVGHSVRHTWCIPKFQHGRQHTFATWRHHWGNDSKVGPTHGTTNMVNQCFMWSLKRPFMGHFKQHYYSGSYYQRHYRRGDSPRHQWLSYTHNSNAIHKGYDKNNTNNWTKQQTKMVARQLIHGPPRNKNSQEYIWQ